MARRKKGKNEFTGKCGDVTFYERGDQVIMRTAKNEKSSKPRTVKQLTDQTKMALINHITKMTQRFIKVGLALQGAAEEISAYNMAIRLNKHRAVTGTYPDQEVDFSKLLLSKGSIPVNEAIDLEITPTGIAVSWDPKIIFGRMEANDRVMLCAYCPEKEEVRTELDGARRSEARCELPLAPYTKKYVYHVYATFIAWNREAISDSVYLGTVNFGKTNVLNDQISDNN